MKFNLKMVQDKFAKFIKIGKQDSNKYFVQYQDGKLFIVFTRDDVTTLYDKSPVLSIDLGETIFKLPYTTFNKLTAKDGTIVDDVVNGVKLKAGKLTLELSQDITPVEPTDMSSLVTDIKLSYGDLLSITTKIADFADGSHTHEALGFVNFSGKDSALDVVATDGSRLALLEGVNNQTPNYIADYMVSSLELKNLSKVLKYYKDKPIELARLDKYNVLAKIGNDVYKLASTDGNYPRYGQLIPLSNSNQHSVYAKLLIGVLKQIKSFVNERTKIIKIDFKERILYCNDDISGNMIDAKYDDAFISDENNNVNELAFNLDFLLEAIKTFDDTQPITLQGNGALSPWLFTQGNHTHLLMPIQTK